MIKATKTWNYLSIIFIPFIFMLFLYCIKRYWI